MPLCNMLYHFVTIFKGKNVNLFDWLHQVVGKVLSLFFVLLSWIDKNGYWYCQCYLKLHDILKFNPCFCSRAVAVCHYGYVCILGKIGPISHRDILEASEKMYRIYSTRMHHNMWIGWIIGFLSHFIGHASCKPGESVYSLYWWIDFNLLLQ